MTKNPVPLLILLVCAAIISISYVFLSHSSEIWELVIECAVAACLVTAALIQAARVGEYYSNRCKVKR